MTVPCNLAASMMYRETARRPARFYALRAASGADGSRPIPTLLPEKGFSSSKSPAGIRRGRAAPQRRATGANLRDSPAPSQTAHRADLRPAAAGTGCSSPLILRRQKQKVPPGYGGTGSTPRQGGKGEYSGTLPRPRKQPTGLICAPLRRGRAVRVLPSFATKTEKSRRDTAGLLFWWRMGDSNPRPLRCERSALTS